ncbi:MAG: hypothetical protein GWO16_00045, partial [Gammaproteobacteria bacterium]|nr:hypothetical protein [Gammaproteobacteria bacterium]NIR96513.1 hypothetical protein [Gammaproteobacteria bacterium]NIT63244.1 hypothetical protein [Gammaproteobacteria bacterium]NIV19294.1 hypothetical protein [Gammaproteobacteria bacterium]NIY31824.1 hypothetical protein [Gammaproteobacteria bacterium]
MSVRVVSCSVEPGEPASLAGQYRVSCAFPDESAGLRFMLELRTHEQAHLDTPIVQVMA